PISVLSLFEVERVVNPPDLMPDHETCEQRPARDWARTQGWVDAADAVLERSATSCAYRDVIRSEAKATVDDEARRRMELIVPHVRRALLIGKAIDLRNAEASTFAGVLEGFCVGVFLVDAGARIIHANAAGHGILQAADFLRAAGGRLVAADAQVDQTFRDVF